MNSFTALGKPFALALLLQAATPRPVVLVQYPQPAGGSRQRPQCYLQLPAALTPGNHPATIIDGNRSIQTTATVVSLKNRATGQATQQVFVWTGPAGLYCPQLTIQ